MARMGNPNWKKGESANPKGRPKKGQSLTDALILRVEEGETKATIVNRLLELAVSEDLQVSLAAVKYIFDRIDGKPVETVRNEDQEKLVNQLDKVLQAVKGELQS